MSEQQFPEGPIGVDDPFLDEMINFYDRKPLSPRGLEEVIYNDTTVRVCPAGILGQSLALYVGPYEGRYYVSQLCGTPERLFDTASEACNHVLLAFVGMGQVDTQLVITARDEKHEAKLTGKQLQ